MLLGHELVIDKCVCEIANGRCFYTVKSKSLLHMTSDRR